MALLKKRIQASTLLETLIAIVLILVCFSIATVVLVNIMQSDNGRMKLHARTELEALYIKTMEEKTFIDEDVEFDTFSIHKTISPYQDSPDLYLLALTATSKNAQVLDEFKKLILVEKHTP
ncbi:MAG: type II secretion system protein [Bacteroidetes bacterium]|nr:type II secretion system protein [Bacteroidota bacterium]